MWVTSFSRAAEPPVTPPVTSPMSITLHADFEVGHQVVAGLSLLHRPASDLHKAKFHPASEREFIEANWSLWVNFGSQRPCQELRLLGVERT